MIRLGIFEDNTAYRTAIQSYFSRIPDMELVHVGEDLQDLEAVLLRTRPEVLLMDIDLPGISGIEGVAIARRVLPSIGIIMLTVFEDEDKIFQSVKAGALGYLLKKDDPTRIAEAVRALARGESVLNGTIARKLLNYFATLKAPAESLDDYNLTKREREILGLLIDGLTYKEIAAKCFISIDTLNSHIRKVYGKLNVHSRAEIAARFR
jgi:DNA-binding NarL/FixJ family response regulator